MRQAENCFNALQNLINQNNLFSGDMVFKVQRDFTIAPGFPTQISAELPGAPDYIDAAFLWVVASNQKYLYVFKVSSCLFIR